MENSELYSNEALFPETIRNMAVKQKNVVGPIVHSPEQRLEIILRVLQNIQAEEGTQTNVYSQIVMGLGE